MNFINIIVFGVNVTIHISFSCIYKAVYEIDNIKYISKTYVTFDDIINTLQNDIRKRVKIYENC